MRALVASVSAPLRTLLLAVGLVGMAVAPADGWAKEKSPGAEFDVKMLGIDSIDEVLKQIKKIDNLVDEAANGRAQGREAINTALGLKEGTPLQTALADLQNKAKGQLKVVSKGGKLQLEATDAVPTNVKAAVDAVNVAMESYGTSIKSLAALPKEIAAVQKKAKGLKPKLKKELTNPANLVKVPEVLGNMKHFKTNLKIAADLPSRTKKVTKNLNGDMKVMVTTFGGQWPPSMGN